MEIVKLSKITISLIKADVGGWPGHSSVHPALMEIAESMLTPEKESGKLIDFKIMAVGDDLQLLMSHTHGTDSPAVSYTHLTLPTICSV